MRRVLILAAGFGLLAASAYAAPTSSPNDPFFAAHEQWALTGGPASIHAPAAWCAGQGSGQLVAVIDSGAEFSHEDLTGKLVKGAAFTGGNGQPSSGVGDVSSGHGTLVAGIVAANTNNSLGIAGVAPGARVLVIKVLGSDGIAEDEDVAAGIEYAGNHGARVINLSLGTDTGVPAGGATATVTAINKWADRIAIAVAAGNNSAGSDIIGVSDKALVVGALGPTGSVASYSNSGPTVNIYAPGGDGGTHGTTANQVVSTWNKGRDSYGFGEGTSFAVPHVAGVLALLRARGYGAQSARARILNTASQAHGVPQLDAAAAMGVPASRTCPAAPTSPPPSGPPTTKPPTKSPTPRPTHTTSPSPTLSATPTPSRTPTPTPSPTTATSEPSPTSSLPVGAIGNLLTDNPEHRQLWPLGLAGGLVVAGAAGVLLARRRPG